MIDTTSGFHHALIAALALSFRGKLLSDAWLTNLYVNIVHPAARAWEDIEYRGVVVDLNRYEFLRESLDAEIGKLEAEMTGLLTHRIRARHKDQISFSRAALVNDYLFSPAGLNLTPRVLTKKTKEASTSYKDHLSMFLDHPDAGPFVRAYRDWGKATKTKSTYVVGFMKHLRPDGRFHATYMLFRGGVYDDPKDVGGARTGRTSAKDPAIQHMVPAFPLYLISSYLSWSSSFRADISFSVIPLNLAAVTTCKSPPSR